jgi:hypothetical protein
MGGCWDFLTAAGSKINNNHMRKERLRKRERDQHHSNLDMKIIATLLCRGISAS